MRIAVAAALAFATIGAQGTAWAQSQGGGLEPRVDRLEREMRAVQRKVFPGGSGSQLVEPQITPQPDTAVPGIPASSPLADLTQRVAALESQIQSMTGEIEQNQHRLREIETAFDTYKAATEARLKALETPPAPAAAPGRTAAAEDSENTAAATPATTPAGPARAAQIAAIAKPNSGDPVEDGYLYGFRLWSAKLYPEARKVLKAVATKYPDSRRASYARNLLGRAYLDDNQPATAAGVFFNNYTKNPNGERAPDSLYYLAQTLVKLEKPAGEVCKVYDELTKVYGERLSPEIQAGVAKGRADSRCK